MRNRTVYAITLTDALMQFRSAYVVHDRFDLNDSEVLAYYRASNPTDTAKYVSVYRNEPGPVIVG